MDPVTISLIVGLAGSALSGWLKGKSAKKKAQAEKTAQQKAYEAQKGLWDANEAQRFIRLAMGNQALGNMQAKLGPGAPNYGIDSALLAGLQKSRPFPGSLPADPMAGLGSAMWGNFAGNIGKLALDYYGAKSTENFWNDWQNRQNALMTPKTSPYAPYKPNIPTGPNYLPKITENGWWG